MPFSCNIEYCNNTVIILCTVYHTLRICTVSFAQHTSRVWEKPTQPDLANMCAHTPGFCQWLGLCLSTDADA